MIKSNAMVTTENPDPITFHEIQKAINLPVKYLEARHLDVVADPDLYAFQAKLEGKSLLVFADMNDLKYDSRTKAIDMLEVSDLKGGIGSVRVALRFEIRIDGKIKVLKGQHWNDAKGEF
ncbi:hypothetical protein [Bdellovibrio sp. BCCA]|uniref:hypothetical protein n=1 Tax=Bdellovibrio sp. BCCA TaxID=3136281 RepID=UPI0030F2B6BC